jgi:hypothetical protein
MKRGLLKIARVGFFVISLVCAQPASVQMVV